MYIYTLRVIYTYIEYGVIINYIALAINPFLGCIAIGALLAWAGPRQEGINSKGPRRDQQQGQHNRYTCYHTQYLLHNICIHIYIYIYVCMFILLMLIANARFHSVEPAVQQQRRSASCQELPWTWRNWKHRPANGSCPSCLAQTLRPKLFTPRRDNSK